MWRTASPISERNRHDLWSRPSGRSVGETTKRGPVGSCCRPTPFEEMIRVTAMLMRVLDSHVELDVHRMVLLHRNVSRVQVQYPKRSSISVRSCQRRSTFTCRSR